MLLSFRQQVVEQEIKELQQVQHVYAVKQAYLEATKADLIKLFHEKAKISEAIEDARARLEEPVVITGKYVYNGEPLDDSEVATSES